MEYLEGYHLQLLNRRNNVPILFHWLHSVSVGTLTFIHIIKRVCCHSHLYKASTTHSLYRYYFFDISPFDIFPFDIFPFDIFPFDIFPFDIFPFDIFPFDIFPFDIFPFDIFPFDIFPFDIFPANRRSRSAMVPNSVRHDL